MPDKWLSIAAAAASLNVHPRTIERRIASGKLQSSRTDDGQIQVCIDIEESPGTALTSFETVRELAQDQVSLATGSASAIVRLAQAESERSRGELSLVRQEASRARQGAFIAWMTVGAMCVAVFVAIGWTSSRIARSNAEIEQMQKTAARIEKEAKELLVQRDAAKEEATKARVASAEAAGKLSAYIEQAQLAGNMPGSRPTSQPADVIHKIAALFWAN